MFPSSTMYLSIRFPMLLACLFNMVLAFPSGLHRAAFKGETNSTETITGHVFDYIVAGGGLTGLAVASRLTEDPSIKVLVIEEGYANEEDRRVNDVRAYGEAFNAELDHGLRSTPVKWQNDSELLLVAGKLLGGSGSLNGASWTKGAKSQYNLLPVLTGDDSWGWNGLAGYMKKAEHFNQPTEKQRDEKGAHYDSLAHGYKGPVEVSFGAEMFGGSQLAALKASEKVWPGVVRNSDAASGVTTGATIIPNMVYPDKHQNRSSPFTAYAEHQVQDRSNFVILTGHRVTEIVWKERNSTNGKLTASGVHLQASENATVHFVAASREVLLAAGSLQSPQLLELSGVGHPDVLSAAGIPVRRAMPGIGKNMQEQTKNTITYNARAEVDFNGTGPPSAITFPSAAQVLGSLERAEEVYNETKANLATYAAELQKAGLVSSANGTHTILEAQLENLFNASDAAAAEVFFTITPAVDNATEQQDAFVGVDNWNLIVLSRGNVHINTSSAWDHPVVEPSYFGHPLDLLFQTQINMQTRQVFRTAPLADFVEAEHTPGLETVPDNAGHKEWEDWVKKTFTSVWHYIGTISMMKEEYGGCVDSKLKLYGIDNVRVVDASVLPIQLSAHLSSSLYGIAEKAADMIKEDQRQSWDGSVAHRKRDSRNTLEGREDKS